MEAEPGALVVKTAAVDAAKELLELGAITSVTDVVYGWPVSAETAVTWRVSVPR